LPISINGSTSFPTTVFLDGGVLESSNGTVMSITNAEVFARNVMATVNPPNNGTFLVSLGDNASIKWQGGNLDIQSGTAFTVVSHDATNTKSYFDGLDITGASGRISYFATSSATYAIESRFKNIQMDAALAGVPFVGTEATSPKVSAEYTVGFNGKPLAYRGSTYGSAGAQTLDLQFAGDSSIYWRVTASIAGVFINSVSRGAFAGQRLIIGNHTSSVSTLSVSNNSGGLLVLGTGAVLDPGEGLCLVWDGSNWRSAAQHF
jgi:hypothetical protein